MPSILGRKDNLLGMTCGEMERLALDNGQPRFRGRQIYQGIYARRQCDWAAFTDLKAAFREYLAAHYAVRYPQIVRDFVSRDGSIRYLLGLDDGEAVEAVFMPEENRTTLCISSQVGCAVDCKFCFTGILGVKRNLTAGEIVGQVLCLAVAHHIPRRSRLNVVFMGMGEPLLNYDPVMKAVEILADHAGMELALRHITVSTSGIIPRILDMAREKARPHLAVSLNASSDEQRTALMPINRKYPLQDLLEACKEYPLRPREKLTFEYVMLGGINDADADAASVAALVRGISAKVNLIPYNSGPGLPYCSPALSRVLAFQKILMDRGVPAFIRISRGQDIMGACGQLRLSDLPDAAARN